MENFNEAALPLESGTMLQQGRWRLLGVSDIGENCIYYDAMDAETGDIVTVREFCPAGICTREGKTLVPAENPRASMQFEQGLEEFRCIAKGLSAIPHIPSVQALFSEHNTAYTVTTHVAGMRLFEAAPLLTETYAQSLGLMLCDTFAALHQNGIYFGTIREEDLRFLPGGGLSVSSGHLSLEGSASNDLRGLTSFLLSMLPIERAENHTAKALDARLRQSYRDAGALRAALLGKKVSRHPVASGGLRGAVCLVFCVAALSGAVLGIRHALNTQQPLTRALKHGKIQPETISVWMPMRSGADEAALTAMYERLAKGFERQNPGCGVEIRIYADGSFENALQLVEKGADAPAVYMDTQDPLVLAQAADLSALTNVMQDVYLADLNGFGNSLPLGCSIPALYYNVSVSDAIDSTSIDFHDLPDGTLYDLSAQDFLEAQAEGQAPADYFEDFLLHADAPVLASSSCMAEAELSSLSAGAVQMIPVSVDGTFPVQYELYCSVSDKVSENSRNVGMLWLQYLLTEEAQQILFVENYGDLPLHQNVFQSAVSIHRGMTSLKGIELDALSLQVRR